MYVGTLTKDGLKIPVGPDPSMFAGESLVTRASTFNQYRVLKAFLDYQPLLNQTNGNSIINTWLTSDPGDDLPADDREVKVTMTSARGKSWFATYAQRYAPVLPQTQLNAYPTGAGGIDPGSDFQAAHYFMIKPTSADNSITNYGEVYVTLSISLSSPMPAPKRAATGRLDLAKDTWIASLQASLRNFLFSNRYARYMAVAESGSKINAYETTTATVTMPNPITNGLTFFTDNLDHLTTPNPTNYTLGNHYKWEVDEGEGAWTDLGPIATTKVYTTYNIAPTVLKNLLDTIRGQLSTDIQPTRLYNTSDQPMEHKSLDENDNEILSIPTVAALVNSRMENLYLEDKVPIVIPDLPVKIEVTEQPVKVTVQEQPIDVNLTNKKITVGVDGSVDTKILDQPISVKEEKSVFDTILDLGGAILPLVLRDDRQQSEQDNISNKSE